ncbi:hypothetical protein Golax_001137, partial [Gossypium laxum]|nr:hypothetical protein [Gossypium laxum]
MQDLVSQPSQRAFSTATSNEYPNAINGLCQCRRDLSTSQCYSCVSNISKISESLWESSSSQGPSEWMLLKRFLYNVYGSSSSGRMEFENRRETSFNMVEEGVKS